MFSNNIKDINTAQEELTMSENLLPENTNEVEVVEANENVTKNALSNEKDFQEYFRICNILINDDKQVKLIIDWLKKNNSYYYSEIVKKLINEFNLGFDPAFKDEQDGNTWPAIIVPTGSCSFVAMSIVENNGKSICRIIGDKTPVNLSSLYGRRPIYIVDGILNAFAVFVSANEITSDEKYEREQCRFLSSPCETVIALLDNDFTGLLEYIDKNIGSVPEYPLMISLNNTEEGYKAAEKLLSELKKRNISAEVCNISGNFQSPYALDRAVSASVDRYMDTLKENISFKHKRIVSSGKSVELMKDYMTAYSAHGSFSNFKEDIKLTRISRAISTGFKSLDDALVGGFYSNLIVIGAVSSLGKTAFVLQLADQIAKNGKDVLFFALEMKPYELMARSLSRETFLWCGDERNPDGIALTTLDILNGLKLDNDDRKAAYDYAEKQYTEYSQHIFIRARYRKEVDDYRNPYRFYPVNTLAGINEAVEYHIKNMKNVPVVIVDYLQLIKAKEMKNVTDKQLVDASITGLKEISTNFDTPVIAVSALNRASYDNKEISFSAFKESGSIEYSCDVLIGLQFKDNSDPNEARKKDPRDIEAVILKQRNGPVGSKIDFAFHSKYNCFEEV